MSPNLGEIPRLLEFINSSDKNDATADESIGSLIQDLSALCLKDATAESSGNSLDSSLTAKSFMVFKLLCWHLLFHDSEVDSQWNVWSVFTLTPTTAVISWQNTTPSWVLS